LLKASVAGSAPLSEHAELQGTANGQEYGQAAGGANSNQQVLINIQLSYLKA
jgi:hypothetical protein